MRDNIEIYKIWAPDGALWTQWAKPVAFAGALFNSWGILDLPKIPWSGALGRDTMVIVDLPGVRGVMEGIALALEGMRPVPLYNGVSGPRNYRTIVDTGQLEPALCKGAEVIAGIGLRPDARPVFLLDSNRMPAIKAAPGEYDNRWCVFPQDMPSASFIKSHGINRIIVRSDFIRNDLAHILGRYQEQGTAIYLCRGGQDMELKARVKPSHFKGFYYRFKVMAGLTRNAAGGFGGIVPEPTQSGSGGRHYGVG